MVEKFALVSVSDKTDIIEFVRILVKHKYNIISTGGTAKYLEDAGIKVIEAGDYTNMKQSNLLKTMHHKISGGLFYAGEDKQSKQFRKDLQLNKITIVVNNFYLEDKAAFFETIDVGGPTMTRTAAKMGLLNGSVAVITSHKQYEQVVKEIEHGEITKETKHNLAIEAFKLLRNYNIKIVDYLLEKYK